jgi:hypothetical protein
MNLVPSPRSLSTFQENYVSVRDCQEDFKIVIFSLRFHNQILSLQLIMFFLKSEDKKFWFSKEIVTTKKEKRVW